MFEDHPFKALGEILDAGRTNPPVVSPLACDQLWVDGLVVTCVDASNLTPGRRVRSPSLHRIALGQGFRMVGDELSMLGRERRIHEFGRAKFAVVMLPVLAPCLISLP